MLKIGDDEAFDEILEQHQRNIESALQTARLDADIMLEVTHPVPFGGVYRLGLRHTEGDKIIDLGQIRYQKEEPEVAKARAGQSKILKPDVNVALYRTQRNGGLVASMDEVEQCWTAMMGKVNDLKGTYRPVVAVMLGHLAEIRKAYFTGERIQSIRDLCMADIYNTKEERRFINPFRK